MLAGHRHSQCQTYDDNLVFHNLAKLHISPRSCKRCPVKLGMTARGKPGMTLGCITDLIGHLLEITFIVSTFVRHVCTNTKQLFI